MKRFGLGLFLIYAVLLITPKAFADDDNHRHANALEMSGIGLAAASVTGGILYLVRRRRAGSNK
jgi:hypothetical protein